MYSENEKGEGELLNVRGKTTFNQLARLSVRCRIERWIALTII